MHQKFKIRWITQIKPYCDIANNHYNDHPKKNYSFQKSDIIIQSFDIIISDPPAFVKLIIPLLIRFKALSTLYPPPSDVEKAANVAPPEIFKFMSKKRSIKDFEE